jgi:UDP-3-O-[3-hydroxymyristoyl] glucosamine N-acyltransferase
VRDHVTIGAGAMAAACAAIANDIEPGTIVSGVPALPHRQSLREQAALRRLPALVTQVRTLQEEVDRLGKKA